MSSCEQENTAESHHFLSDTLTDIEGLLKYVSKNHTSISEKFLNGNFDERGVIKCFKKLRKFVNAVKERAGVIDSALNDSFDEWCQKRGVDKNRVLKNHRRGNDDTEKGADRTLPSANNSDVISEKDSTCETEEQDSNETKKESKLKPIVVKLKDGNVSTGSESVNISGKVVDEHECTDKNLNDSELTDKEELKNLDSNNEPDVSDGSEKENNASNKKILRRNKKQMEKAALNEKNSRDDFSKEDTLTVDAKKNSGEETVDDISETRLGLSSDVVENGTTEISNSTSSPVDNLESVPNESVPVNSPKNSESENMGNAKENSKTGSVDLDASSVLFDESNGDISMSAVQATETLDGVSPSNDAKHPEKETSDEIVDSSIIVLDTTVENDSVVKTESENTPSENCEEKPKSKIGILKLVDLNKLIDKPKAWLHEALALSPKPIPNVVVLNSSSEDERNSKKKSFEHDNKKNKRTRKKQKYSDDSDWSEDSKKSSRLRNRVQQKQEDLSSKFQGFRNTRRQRAAKKYIELSSSDESVKSADESVKSKDESVASKDESVAVKVPVQTAAKKKEYDVPEIPDAKCYAPCKVVIERMDDPEKCFEEWKHARDLRSIERLADLDSLKSKKKRNASQDSSDSNSANDKSDRKKKQVKFSDRDEVIGNGDADLAENSDINDELPVDTNQTETVVDMDTPVVLLSSSSSDEEDAEKKDDEKQNSTEKDQTEESAINVSNSENQGSDEKVDETNEKLNEGESGLTEQDKINGESSTKDGECDENKKSPVTENCDDNGDDSDDAFQKKSTWKKDKLLTESIDINEKKDLSSSEEERRYKKKKERIDKESKKERKHQKKRNRIITSESEADSDSKSAERNDEVGNVESDDDDVKNQKKSSDSEHSSGEFFQTKLKRKKGSSSSGNASNSSDNEKSKKKKNVRKRIKRINDSDDSSDEEGGKSKTRKNIRSVIKDDSLSKSTREAAKEEEKRKKRIAERQRTYNEMFEMDDKTDKRVDKVVLDFDADTKTELLAAHPKLVEKLKPHQAKGVKFMFDACFESLERSKKDKGSGCILAHCMGLGKTLQVITLIHTLITNPDTGIRTVMVVCPLSTVLNWVNEFKIWLTDINDGDDINVYEISRYKKNYERAYHIDDWQECGGVLVVGYEMYRILSSTTNKKIRKKVLNSLQKGLVDPGPDMVVCDEGHLLKNEKSRLSIAMNRLRTLRRIVLTGTPLQNNLKEYFCMIQFVKPNLLGKYSEYTNRFVNPITNGQYTDSTPHDIAVMKRRSHVLHKMLDGVVERRDYSVLAPFLPPKHEYVVFLRLTDIQVKLYEIYMRDYARKGDNGRAVTLFNDFQELQRIWTHPRMMRAHSDKYEKDQEKKGWLDEESEGSLKDFIDDDDESAETSASESDGSEDSDGSHKRNKKSKKAAPRRRTRAMAAQLSEEDEEEPKVDDKPHNPTEWWVKYIEGNELDSIEHSAKLLMLFDILKKCEAIGDKLLVFSQSLYSLDLIEHFLEKVDEATQNGENSSELLRGHTGSWSLGLDYFRLDGSSSVENRAAWCKSFNNEDNPRARLFLISTKAGGLGINLVAANRVIIFDVSWNPSHDVQSIFRIYRFGQKKPCYVYRFIAMGTMEEKVYERQVTKQAISKRVIDEQQIDRHYNQNDLAELYKFSPVPEGDRPIPMLPKDRMFAELLKEYETLIYRYHEHDSLLENKEEEELDEAERKAAWEEFENEKTAKPAPNNMMAGMVRQAQITPEQAAYIIQMMLRQENPQWSGEQVRQGVPVVLQQMYATALTGDWTMYNRVLSYQQQLTFQQQLLAAQTRLMNPSVQNQAMYNMHNAGMQNVFTANEKARQAQYQANQNRMYTAGLPSTSAQNDPNEVVDLD